MQSSIYQFLFSSTLNLNFAVNKLIQVGCPKNSLVPVRLILHVTDEAQGFSKKLICECVLASGGLEVGDKTFAKEGDKINEKDVNIDALDTVIKLKEDFVKKSPNLISQNLANMSAFKFPSILDAIASSDRLFLLGVRPSDVISAIDSILFLNKAAFSIQWPTALAIIEFHRGAQLQHGAKLYQCLAAEKEAIRIEFYNYNELQKIKDELILIGLTEDEFEQIDTSLVVNQKLWKKLFKIKAKIKNAHGELSTKAGRLKL